VSVCVHLPPCFAYAELEKRLKKAPKEFLVRVRDVHKWSLTG